MIYSINIFDHDKNGDEVYLSKNKKYYFIPTSKKAQ